MPKPAHVFLCLVAVSICQAKVITVGHDGSADFDSIQDAINHSWNGDTVIVQPGVYNENVVFNGRAIIVTSKDPSNPGVVQSTVIEVTSGYSVTFDFGEGNDSVLTGFTITGRGIYCSGSSPTISRNVIRDCSSSGIYGENDPAPTILENRVISNEGPGIYWCDGPITANTISENVAGLAYCNGLISGNVVSNNRNTDPGYGGGLYYCDGDIIGNVVTNNYALFMGGGLFGCDGSIANNIVAGNRAGLSGGGLYNCNRSILNNTVVGNVATEKGGGMCNCAGDIRSNIIAFNEAGITGGIYGTCSNHYNSFWMNEGGNLGGGATVGSGDIITDPLFAANGSWNDKGTPDRSDDFWVDGDYHLKSGVGRWDSDSGTWTKDAETSHCIDAGDPNSTWAMELWPHGKRINIGAYGNTPEASMSAYNAGNVADIDNDGSVYYRDLLLLTNKWLHQGSPLAEDLNRMGIVDFEDFAILLANWGVEPPPPTPPQPDPMTWATEPHATSPYSITMVATTATSTDGSGIEYYFQEHYRPEINSGWITFGLDEEAKWVAKELSPETLYWFEVKARNRGNLLETQWAERAAATTPREDTVAPSPNPSTWQTQPYATSPTSIRMVATTASDPSGVEYHFECTSHPAYSGNWQDSSIYEVTSLPKDTYKFVTRSRDKSPNQNTTGYSAEAAVDIQPPTPDPMGWEVEPYKFRGSGGTFDWRATMTATEAADEAGVQYYFECTNEPGFSSGWQNERTWTVRVGGQHVLAVFRVKARDMSPAQNETGWSSALPAMP